MLFFFVIFFSWLIKVISIFFYDKNKVFSGNWIEVNILILCNLVERFYFFLRLIWGLGSV